MNESTNRVTANHFQQPQNDHYYINCPQHVILLSFAHGFTAGVTKYSSSEGTCSEPTSISGLPVTAGYFFFLSTILI